MQKCELRKQNEFTNDQVVFITEGYLLCARHWAHVRLSYKTRPAYQMCRKVRQDKKTRARKSEQNAMNIQSRDCTKGRETVQVGRVDGRALLRCMCIITQFTYPPAEEPGGLQSMESKSGTRLSNWAHSHTLLSQELCVDQSKVTIALYRADVCLSAAFLWPASLIAQLVKSLLATQETLVWFLGQEDPLKKG